MKYAVYVLESQRDGLKYIGFTDDLKKRLEKHKNGLVESTKNRRPLKLIYCEICIDKHDALRREHYFKTGFGRRFLANRLNNYFAGSRGGRAMQR